MKPVGMPPGRLLCSGVGVAAYLWIEKPKGLRWLCVLQIPRLHRVFFIAQDCLVQRHASYSLHAC
jgi:hypothetical protein